MKTLLKVENLTVDIPTEHGVVHAVKDVSFDVREREFFGIVGESGSGKSVLVQTAIGLVDGVETSGRVLFRDEDLLTCTQERLRQLRGADIAMIFQDPLSSLHPQYTIGWQLVEQIRAHEKVSRQAAKSRAIEMLRKVRIPESENRFDAYPHQFSGGMRQRAMIAMALSLNPRLIIADEPTTALDSTVQAQILSLLAELQEDTGSTVLMISHDLSVMASVADRVLVMQHGHQIEIGESHKIFGNPEAKYTKTLLASSMLGSKAHRVPSLGADGVGVTSRTDGAAVAPTTRDVGVSSGTDDVDVGSRTDGTSVAPSTHGAGITPRTHGADGASTYASEHNNLAQATGEHLNRMASLESVSVTFVQRRGEPKTVLDAIDLEVRRGETLGLVGESGCGKTTLARTIAGLVRPSSGAVSFDGKNITDLAGKEWRDQRKRVQVVFQDPFGSLNPKRRVGSIIGDPLRIHKVGTKEERKERVCELLELVGLSPEHYNRYPSQFSGGQRQRIGIARALALHPDLVILDEPVSALDVTVQAQVLDLLDSLQQELGLTYLFISHDLAVVRHMCDRIAVMEGGKIVELGESEDIYANPQHPFTKKLLSAAFLELSSVGVSATGNSREGDQ